MKLKFNWGTGIAVFIALFLLVNAFVIYKSLQERYDLVSEEYYPQGLEYQKQIDRFANANALSGKITISQDPQNLLITYPVDMKHKDVNGQVVFFRPSDENADFRDSLQFDSTMVQRVPVADFVAGKYVAKFFWKMNGIEYAHEQSFRVNK
jgi:hypothetical protein